MSSIPKSVKALIELGKTPRRGMLFSRLYRLQMRLNLEGRDNDHTLIDDVMKELKLLRIATGYYGDPTTGPICAAPPERRGETA